MSKFLKNDDGSVALMVGLLVLVLMMFIGAALDFNRATKAKVELQAVADTAVLAALSKGSTDATRFINSELLYDSNVDEAQYEYIKPTFSEVSPSEYKVEIQAAVKTSILSIIGISKIDVQVESFAAASEQSINLALVLDVSGSMNAPMGTGKRLTVMQDAAKQLIDTLSKDGTNPNFRAGLVPFSTMVNVGASNTDIVQGEDSAIFAGTSWAGCVMERRGAHTNSTSYVASTSSPKGMWHAYYWPPEPNSGPGCQNPSNGSNEGYQSVAPETPGNYAVFTPGPNYNCLRHALEPVSTNAGAVKSRIDGLTAEYNNGTILAPGVAWGNRILSAKQPFDSGAKNGDRQILIVLTDGEQTTEAEYNDTSSCAAATNTTAEYQFDPSSMGLDGEALSTNGPRDLFTPYGYILDSDPFGSNPASQSDVNDDLYDLSLDACNQAKNANGIEVFSIAVSSAAGPGTTVYNLLQQCASDPEHFFYADDAAALVEAFREIGEEIGNVRLTG